VAEDRRQKSGVRRQKSEDRRQETEVRSQETEVRRQETEVRRRDEITGQKLSGSSGLEKSTSICIKYLWIK
jgi:hypothetical protein